MICFEIHFPTCNSPKAYYRVGNTVKPHYFELIYNYFEARYFEVKLNPLPWFDRRLILTQYILKLVISNFFHVPWNFEIARFDCRFFMSSTRRTPGGTKGILPQLAKGGCATLGSLEQGLGKSVFLSRTHFTFLTQSGSYQGQSFPHWSLPHLNEIVCCGAFKRQHQSPFVKNSLFS